MSGQGGPSDRIAGRGGWWLLWGGFALLLLAVTLAARYENPSLVMGFAPMAGLTGALLLGIASFGDRPQSPWVVGAVLWGIVACLAVGMLTILPWADREPAFVAAAAGLWLAAWMLVARVAAWMRGGLWALVPPAVFGLTLIWAWEAAVRALEVPRVILPPPSAIAARIASSTDILWTDLVQTVFKGALSGFAIGCGAAILFALVVDRFDFLRRGLLPVGNFLAALPIIGTAPIMVMWFGFDWPSKAAVVVAMVFFPMLVNTVQGLAATDSMQRDLMRTWSASWWQALWGLRLPAAMPFIFNGLKICATLALIGAIVAEFFGSPTRGMGFRISTEVGRLQLDMVWAEIAVAALAGSAFYGIWALLERRVTFWHPSQRGR
jgi:NitT/TauT family transport system permease protein